MVTPTPKTNQSMQIGKMFAIYCRPTYVKYAHHMGTPSSRASIHQAPCLIHARLIARCKIEYHKNERFSSLHLIKSPIWCGTISRFMMFIIMLYTGFNNAPIRTPNGQSKSPNRSSSPRRARLHGHDSDWVRRPLANFEWRILSEINIQISLWALCILPSQRFPRTRPMGWEYDIKMDS